MKSNTLKVKVIYWKINWNFPWQIITSLNISLSDENVFGSWPSFSTFKAHISFLWKFTNKGDRKKIQNGHMTVPNKEFPAALMLDATGYAWSVDTVDFLNDCCRTNFFCIGWTWRLREYSINKHTVIFLFRTRKTLSFLLWPCLLNG